MKAWAVHLRSCTLCTVHLRSTMYCALTHAHCTLTPYLGSRWPLANPIFRNLHLLRTSGNLSPHGPRLILPPMRTLGLRWKALGIPKSSLVAHLGMGGANFRSLQLKPQNLACGARNSENTPGKLRGTYGLLMELTDMYICIHMYTC